MESRRVDSAALLFTLNAEFALRALVQRRGISASLLGLLFSCAHIALPDRKFCNGRVLNVAYGWGDGRARRDVPVRDVCGHTPCGGVWRRDVRCACVPSLC